MQSSLLRLPPALIVVTVAGALVIAQRPAPSSVAAGEWRYYAGDAASSKYSPLAQITRDNVSGLEVAWRWSSVDNEIVKLRDLEHVTAIMVTHQLGDPRIQWTAFRFGL